MRLSEHHLDEFAVEFVYSNIYIYHTLWRKSLPALILWVFVSFVDSKLFTNYWARRNQPSTSSIATARTETPVSVLCMSVHFVSYTCTPSDGAAWSLLVGCIICSKQHCCWPCSWHHATTDRSWLPTQLCCAYVCRFCGLCILFHILWPVYSVYSVARGCSMLNHILMTVMYLCATASCSVRALAQAHPTMSYIHLVSSNPVLVPRPPPRFCLLPCEWCHG